MKTNAKSLALFCVVFAACLCLPQSALAGFCHVDVGYTEGAIPVGPCCQTDADCTAIDPSYICGPAGMCDSFFESYYNSEIPPSCNRR